MSKRRIGLFLAKAETDKKIKVGIKNFRARKICINKGLVFCFDYMVLRKNSSSRTLAVPHFKST